MLSHTLKLRDSSWRWRLTSSAFEYDHEDWQFQNQKHDLDAYKQINSEPSCRVSCKQIGRWPLFANPLVAQNQKALPAIQNLLAGPKTLEEQEAGPGPNSKLFHDAIKLFALVVGAQWLLEQISLFICHILAGVCSFKLCQTRKKSSTRALNPFLGKLGVQASNAMPILNLCPHIFNSIVNVFFDSTIFRFNADVEARREQIAKANASGFNLLEAPGPPKLVWGGQPITLQAITE